MAHRFLQIIFILTLTAGFASAQSVPAVREVSMVDGFRDSMYLQDVDDGQLYRIYRTLRTDLDKSGLESRELLFQSSRAAYYMARGYQAFDTVEKVLAQDDDMRAGRFKVMQKSYTNLPDIIALYEESMSLSEGYLKGGRDARGVRLYTEALSQLSTLKNLGFLMSNGTKIQPLAEEAVSLDPGEVKAHLLLSSRYVYSPGIWGGDPGRGIAMLEDIARMPGVDKEDRHNINVGMGFAHTMAKEWGKALPFFQKAAEIYPGNIYAEAMVRLCEQKKP